MFPIKNSGIITFLTKRLMKLDPLISILFTTEKGCHLAKISTACFALLALLALSDFFGDSWQSTRGAFFSEKEKASLQTESSKSKRATSFLAESHLFGYDPPAATAATLLTNSGLHITGLIFQEDPAQVSKVILSSKGGLGKVYQEGERLPGGKRVVSIKQDGLLLDNEGHLEFLPLQRPRLERRT